MESTDALLLRKTKLTETSLIVTWFTSHHGRLKTVAKGARRPKNKFAGVLDLFFECEIQFSRSRKTELHILRECVLTNPNEGLRTDYQRVALSAYFVELIELVTECDHPEPQIYDLLRRALAHLNLQPPSRRVMLHFESELARALGIQSAAVTAAVAIGRASHRLPSTRPALLKSLPER